jgi:hypothetical protein
LYWAMTGYARSFLCGISARVAMGRWRHEERWCKGMARTRCARRCDGAVRPPGTVSYPKAWVYLSIFTSASVLARLYLMRRDPALLQRRMSRGPTAENRPAQKLIMLCTSIGFIALLVVPAFDHPFGWSAVPLGGVVAGDVLVAFGFCLIGLVYRENTFTSATIDVVENQKVVSTGLTRSFAIRCLCAGTRQSPDPVPEAPAGGIRLPIARGLRSAGERRAGQGRCRRRALRGYP